MNTQIKTQDDTQYRTNKYSATLKFVGSEYHKFIEAYTDESLADFTNRVENRVMDYEDNHTRYYYRPFIIEVQINCELTAGTDNYIPEKRILSHYVRTTNAAYKNRFTTDLLLNSEYIYTNGIAQQDYFTICSFEK